MSVDLLNKESAFYHSINLGFDAEVAEKFLKGIYYQDHKIQMQF